MEGKKQSIGLNEQHSLDRPAWTSDDWNAFNHRHTQPQRFGDDVRPAVIRNYFVKSGGLL